MTSVSPAHEYKCGAMSISEASVQLPSPPAVLSPQVYTLEIRYHNLFLIYRWQVITTCDDQWCHRQNSLVFLTRFILWCLKIYFEDDLWVCFLMRHSIGQFCLAQCFIKGGRWLFIYLYTVLMIQCMTLFFLEFTNSFKEIFHLQMMIFGLSFFVEV